MLVPLVAGVGFGLSLIIAIGAQNAYVLRQGLRREHVFAVVAVCAISDVVLIAVGVGGLGSLIQAAPWLLDTMRFGGAAFLIAYGALAARRALRPVVDRPRRDRHDDESAYCRHDLPRADLAQPTRLSRHRDPARLGRQHIRGRTLVVRLGAAIGSIVWFTALGYGARVLRPLFAKPAAWRVLDALIALVMFAIAASLLRGVA